MPALRKAPNTTDYPSGLKGSVNADLVNTEILELWFRVSCWLDAVAGTNTITATVDPTLDQYAQPMAFWLVPAVTNTSSVTINIDGLGAKAVVAADGGPLTGGELASSEMALIVYDGTSFRLMRGSGGSGSLSPAPDYVLHDEKSVGTSGGTFTLGSWRTRDLNTEARAALAGGSLTSNQFTLPAGSYWIEWEAPAFKVDSHQSRLYNATDASVVEYGQSTEADSATDISNVSRGASYVTLTSSKAFEIQHRCDSSAGDGFGLAVNYNDKELYTVVRIWRAEATENQVEGRHGGGITIEYVFDDTITEADPGDGKLRFNSATPGDTGGTPATKIFADLLARDLTDYTAVLASIDGGEGRVVKSDDPSKWIIFSVTGRTDETGYKDFDISVIDASGPAPFADADRVLFMLGSPGASALITGTSSTSVAIGVGTKNFTTQASRQWQAGDRVRIKSSANPDTNYMGGAIASYSGTALQVAVDYIGGAGTLSDWLINMEGEPGAVVSVNGKTGVAVIDPDDLDDSATTNKFATAAEKTKVGFISVTQAVDLDAIETRVNSLDAAIVLRGTWDASTALFPNGSANPTASTEAGDSYIVSTGGTVDSVVFVAGDRLIAITDGASTSTYAANWHKADYTDAVLSVNGKTGAAVIDPDDLNDSGTTNKFTSAGDISKLAGIEAGADVTDAVNVASTIVGVSAKSTPVDADTLGLIDSAASNVLKELSWANIKATLKTYFDTLYGPRADALEFVIDGGGSVITTGVKGDIEVPFACTIDRNTALADQSGSIVVDVWVDSYANYPPTDADSITASAPVTITTALKSQDSTLTGWTTSLSAGDIIRFNVDSVTSIKRATISLKVTK